MFKSTAILMALALGTMVAPPVHAVGRVEVIFVEPEHYTDAGRGSFDRERTTKSFAEYFQTLARRLPDGQTLRLDVLDIDLAGELRPWGSQEVRVLRGRADWPRMTLRYSLQSEGRTLLAGEASLADMSYMLGLRGHAGQGFRGSEFGYEKRMLQQWFDQTFITP